MKCGPYGTNTYASKIPEICSGGNVVARAITKLPTNQRRRPRNLSVCDARNGGGNDGGVAVLDEYGDNSAYHNPGKSEGSFSGTSRMVVLLTGVLKTAIAL